MCPHTATAGDGSQQPRAPHTAAMADALPDGEAPLCEEAEIAPTPPGPSNAGDASAPTASAPISDATTGDDAGGPVDAPVEPTVEDGVPMPALDALPFLVSVYDTNPAVVSRLLTELLLDEGRALTAVAAESDENASAYATKRRRKDERCPLCADNSGAPTCAVCGCLQCLRKLGASAYVACPDCRERFHVDCFTTTHCRGCEMAVLAHQPASSSSSASASAAPLSEQAVADYLARNAFDAELERGFRAFAKQANAASLTRLHKALTAARGDLIRSLHSV